MRTNFLARFMEEEYTQGERYFFAGQAQLQPAGLPPVGRSRIEGAHRRPQIPALRLLDSFLGSSRVKWRAGVRRVLIAKIREAQSHREIVPFHRRDDRLKIVAALARHPQFVALNRGGDLDASLPNEL